MIIGMVSAQDILQVMVHLIQVRKAFNILKQYLEMKLILSHVRAEHIGESTQQMVLSLMSVNSTGTKLTIKRHR